MHFIRFEVTFIDNIRYYNCYIGKLHTFTKKITTP